MRCARLLSNTALQTDDRAVARDESGLCCEVYPDPALHHWTAGAKRARCPGELKGPDSSNRRRDLLAIVDSKLELADPCGLLDRIARQDDDAARALSARRGLIGF
jgi:hypothetical protein